MLAVEFYTEQTLLGKFEISARPSFEFQEIPQEGGGYKPGPQRWLPIFVVHPTGAGLQMPAQLTLRTHHELWRLSDCTIQSAAGGSILRYGSVQREATNIILPTEIS